jgi:hypothetical protein
VRRILATLTALVVALGGMWIASAGAQTDPQPTAPLGTWCPPVPSDAIAGQPVQCKVVADPDWTAPTTQPPTSTTTTTSTTVPPVTTTTTTVPPVTTTTSTPPASLMGWQLTSSNIGLAPHGLNCDTMPLYTGPNKPAAGTTVTGWRIEKFIDMSAGNVTLDKVCVRPRTQGINGALVTTTVRDGNGGCCYYGLPPGTTATVKDSEIDGSLISAGNIAQANGFDGAGNLSRNYIHDTGSGIAFRETGTAMSFVVENNYVHRLRHAGEAHHDGATVRDFVKNSTNTRTLVWRNNRFDSRNDSGAWETAAFVLQPTWSCCGVHNVRLEGNLLEGKAYNLTLEQHNGGHSGAQSVNNRFWQPAGCDSRSCYGSSSVTGSPGWAVWSNNFKYDPTKLNAQGVVVNP